MRTSSMALPLLDRVGVASACSASWEEMTGDEKTRHCAQCNLKVHNLSAMTRDEAEALLRSKGDGRLCIGFYRRADGTVLTQDCPVGIARARAKARRLVGRVAAALGLMSAAAAAGVDTSRQNSVGPIRLRALNPFSMLAEWLVPTPPMPPAVSPNMTFTLGDGCIARPLTPLNAAPSQSGSSN